MPSKTDNPKAKFTQNTQEHAFSVNERHYVLRHCNGDTCCDAPWSEDADWPSASFVPNTASSDDGGNNESRDYKVIGGVWTRSDKKLVAVWVAEEGDGHVDFFCSKDYDELAQQDLSEISDQLCTEICEELIDVFDDGSGSEREPGPVDNFNCPEWLTNYYRE